MPTLPYTSNTGSNAIRIAASSLDGRPSRQRVPTSKGADYAAELAKENEQIGKTKSGKKRGQVPKKSVTSVVPATTNTALVPSGFKMTPLASSLIGRFVAPDEDPFEDEPSVQQSEMGRPLSTTGVNFQSRQQTLSKAHAAAPKPKHLHKPAAARPIAPSPQVLQKEVTTRPAPCVPEKLLQENSAPAGANLSSSEHDDLESESAKVPHIRNRPRIGDLSPEFRGLVKYTVADYRSVLSTCGPFPDATEEQVMAGAALHRASRALKISMPDDILLQTLIDLVVARDSQLRSELRTKTIPLVGLHYGFNGSCSPRCIAENKQLYTVLKAGDSFLFKAPASHDGLFEHPIFQEILNSMWFKDARDEGIKFEKYFTPIPLQTLAFIFTAVEYVIDHWSSGTFRPVTCFTANAYQVVYQKHLSTLKSVSGYSATAKERLRRIRTRMLGRARRNAGMSSAQALPVFDEIYIAQFEQEDEDTDSDSEIMISKSTEASNNGHPGKYNENEEDDEGEVVVGRKRSMPGTLKSNKRFRVISDVESQGDEGEGDGEGEGEDKDEGDGKDEGDSEDEGEGGGEGEGEGAGSYQYGYDVGNEDEE